MELRTLELESAPAGAIMATLTETAISESRQVFDYCDRNGDGFIDSAEFRALLEQLDGDVSSAECQLNFEAADTEGDGYIGFKEFVAWWTN
jgi:calmodulin